MVVADDDKNVVLLFVLFIFYTYYNTLISTGLYICHHVLIFRHHHVSEKVSDFLSIISVSSPYFFKTAFLLVYYFLVYLTSFSLVLIFFSPKIVHHLCFQSKSDFKKFTIS